MSARLGAAAIATLLATAPASALFAQGRTPPSMAAAPVGDEAALYTDAAAVAWRFVQANLQPTGMVGALGSYPDTTVWDIGSGLAALYCGHELGLMDDAPYDLQMRRVLHTLEHVDLFDGAAFNKSYSTRTGAMAGRERGSSRRGSGWSAIDVGRLLLWLKIIAVHQPQYAADAAAVAHRLSAARVVRDGYLQGSSLERDGRVHDFQEGRIGYEQYAARGFAAWAFPVANALDLNRNAVPITVMGKNLVADVRGKDRLTAEPFALMGLELGLTPEARAVTEQLLAAMEERYRRSGRLTMLAEDAINLAPHYFFYYCAYTNGKEFAIDVQDPAASVDGPRWVSTKAAFAWRVLYPSDYTAKVLAAVMPSRDPAGWDSGVYEGDGRSTGTANVNTEAVILEAALFRKRGAPLLEGAR
jgi:hypothetical protein